jgi:hypothetical protein
MRDTKHTHPTRLLKRPRLQGALQRCPCCQLAIRPRYPQMALDYCPRCIAREHRLISMQPSAA